MSVELENRPAVAEPEAEAKPSRKKEKKAKKAKKAARKDKKARALQKRTMNLYYKPDRTTKPATVALYVLFILVCLMGLGKILVYDLWVEVVDARETLATEEARLNDVLEELKDYDEVLVRYNRYAATEEERALIDRMQVLALLDGAVGVTAEMDTIAITGDTVQLQFYGVTLAQTARIVNALEASPIVAGTEVHTASTTEKEAANGLVQANILIYLQKEAEE